MKIRCSYTRLVPVAELKPNPRNPNTHPKKQIELLAKVIKETGWRAPVVVSKRSGLIVKGHGRLAAAQLLKCEVPVDDQDYESEAQEWADMIADNRLAELAEIDESELSSLLKELGGQIDAELTGFTASEFDDLVNNLDPTAAAVPKFDEADQLSKLWKTEVGQIWELGKHRLMCGDSGDPEQVKMCLNGEAPAVSVLNPPWEEKDKWVTHIMDPCIVMGVVAHMRAIPVDLWRFERVIDKGIIRGHRSATTCIRQRHGLIAQCGTIKTIPSSVANQTFDSIYTAKDHENHPHEKPIDLLVEHLHYFTPPWEMVFDPYAGSGSTIFAAEKLKRRCCAMELTPQFTAVILQRWLDTYVTRPVRIYPK